jgi:hypothetical protein
MEPCAPRSPVCKTDSANHASFFTRKLIYFNGIHAVEVAYLFYESAEQTNPSTLTCCNRRRAQSLMLPRGRNSAKETTMIAAIRGPEYYRRQAEVARKLATVSKLPDIRYGYLQIARAYEVLAAEVEVVKDTKPAT